MLTATVGRVAMKEDEWTACREDSAAMYRQPSNIQCTGNHQIFSAINQISVIVNSTPRERLVCRGGRLFRISTCKYFRKVMLLTEIQCARAEMQKMTPSKACALQKRGACPQADILRFSFPPPPPPSQVRLFWSATPPS